MSQNLDHHYSLTSDEKKYLAGLGVQPDVLLERMNRTNVGASARARDYVARFGDMHGVLTKPVLTIHTTLDTLADIRNDSAYRETVEASGSLNNLVQAYVAGLGHCAFTANQLLAALAAMEGWLDTGTQPGASAFPAGLGFDNAFVPPPWPWPSVVQPRGGRRGFFGHINLDLPNFPADAMLQTGETSRRE